MAKLTEEEKARLRIALQKNLDRNKLFKGMTKKEISKMKFKDPEEYGVPTALDSLRYKEETPKSQKWIVVDPITRKEHSFTDSTNAQNYIKFQTEKMNEPPKPPKPTTYELEAQAIKRFREGKASAPDSSRLGIVPTDIQQAKKDVKTPPSNLDQILAIGKKIEEVRDSKAYNSKEKRIKIDELQAKADSLKAMDPITIKVNNLLNVLTDTTKTPVKVEKPDPYKVQRALTRDQKKEVQKKVWNIQSENPKMIKKERLEIALKELGHIQ